MRRNGRLFGVGLALLGAGVLACVQPSARETNGDLLSSLDVKVAGDSARITLNVTNAGSSAVVLEFGSTQRADFQVRTPSGDGVWTWSAARSFAQVVGEETLAPGETVEYSGVWQPTSPGEYEAVGFLTSSNRRVEMASPFEVPAQE